jgi:hypothetical protein
MRMQNAADQAAAGKGEMALLFQIAPARLDPPEYDC